MKMATKRCRCCTDRRDIRRRISCAGFSVKAGARHHGAFRRRLQRCVCACARRTVPAALPASRWWWRTGPAVGSTLPVKPAPMPRPTSYDLPLCPIETLAYNQFLFKKISYDPRSFEPISNAMFVTAGLILNSGLKAKSLDELAAVSKAKPNTMSCTSPAVPLAYFMEQWKKESGADLVKVPYRGGGDAVNGILGGSTPVAFSGIANFIPHILLGHHDGACRRHRRRGRRCCPTCRRLREIGYKGPLTPAYFGYVAPKGTPKAAIDTRASAHRSDRQRQALRRAQHDQPRSSSRFSIRRISCCLPQGQLGTRRAGRRGIEPRTAMVRLLAEEIVRCTSPPPKRRPMRARDR